MVPLALGPLILCAAVACGGSPAATGTPRPSAAPTSTSIALQSATLTTADFADGATVRSPTDVPDLTATKCSPSTSAGLVQQYKSEVQAVSGRIYGNVVGGFDTAQHANDFITHYFTASQSCSDAPSPGVKDDLGTYSFSYAITQTPSDLAVEAVQLDKYVSVIIQLLPAGTQAGPNSLRSLIQTSVDKLSTVLP
ncbi:MAG: hypothetical protein ACREN2_02425 [Candidatus Dormibacteria bacterium]